MSTRARLVCGAACLLSGIAPVHAYHLTGGVGARFAALREGRGEVVAIRFARDPGLAEVEDPRCPTTSFLQVGVPGEPPEEIRLPCSAWRAAGDGYRFYDRAGTTGVRRAVYRPGMLLLRLRRVQALAPPVPAVDVRLRVGSAEYCGRFTSFSRNEAGRVDAFGPSVGCSVPGPAFTDVTAAAGVDYVQYHVPEPLQLTGPDFMTGAAAAGDYDGDGWVDLFVTRLDAPDILFRNRGDGTFADATAEADLDGFNLRSNGAAWGDVDNDGDLDLYVTTHEDTRFYLFVNDGAGHFTEEARQRGAAIETPDVHFGFSATFGDYDRDGWLDLHTTEWRRNREAPAGSPGNTRLLRNRGAEAPGHFEDVTEAAGVNMDPVSIEIIGVADPAAFASRFTDLDADGWPDLAIASDFLTSRLFWNNGDGTFTDGTVAAGAGTDENGMGSAVGDYDGDGLLDWFVTSIYDPLDLCNCSNGLTGNRLYRNEGNRVFSDHTDHAGVRDGGWGWGAAFFDYDNDGDLDLIMNNGQDWPDPYIPGADFHNRDAVRFWRNDGGAMTEIANGAGVAHRGTGKGVLTFDYDRDGDLDLFLTTTAGHPVLYRNDGGSDLDWLRVVTVGRDSNRQGLGARITVTADAAGPTQLREVDAGSHFLGQSETAAHFGLGAGDGPVHEVRVQWPSGRTQRFTDVPRRSTLAAIEPES